MANQEQLKILRQGVSVWNAWRANHPEIQIDLKNANLRVTDLSGADLSSADLIRAHLVAADLSRVNLSGADLSMGHLRGTEFRGANLSRATLIGATLSGAILLGADLSGADFSGADLWRADLREAFLREADCRATKLIEVNLNGATLTDACLWETQRAGWSIQGVICEAIYWDKDRQERITYAPGEFERLYADKTRVILKYAGGILSPIEVATLPSMIEIMQKWSNCVLRLD